MTKSSDCRRSLGEIKFDRAAELRSTKSVRRRHRLQAFRPKRSAENGRLAGPSVKQPNHRQPFHGSENTDESSHQIAADSLECLVVRPHRLRTPVATQEWFWTISNRRLPQILLQDSVLPPLGRSR